MFNRRSVGEMDFRYIAVDMSGNKAMVMRIVTITDTKPPYWCTKDNNVMTVLSVAIDL